MPVVEKFNPAASFVVRKPMTLAGVQLTLGDLFPKDTVAERRLRQLYTGRWIAQLPVGDTVNKKLKGENKREKKRG